MAAWATGVGHDQTRKNRAWRAHRWAGSVRRNPVPLLGREIGLSRAENERVGLRSDLAGGNRVGFAASLGDELAPDRLPVFAKDIQRLGQVGPVRGQLDERQERCPRLAQRQGRGFEARP